MLVHGDYHLNNAIFGLDGTVRAILDWELCTVGDPLADVGLMVAYWNELGRHATRDDALWQPVTVLPGFPEASELALDYAAASGRDLGELGFWVAFAYWKVAVIVEGVYRRWLNDPTNGSDAGGLARRSTASPLARGPRERASTARRLGPRREAGRCQPRLRGAPKELRVAGKRKVAGQTSPRKPGVKRDRIMDVATEYFGHRGYEDTKWPDVAAAVGIGSTALYHYFESKQHCLYEIMVEAVTDSETPERITSLHDDWTEVVAILGTASSSTSARSSDRGDGRARPDRHPSDTPA